MMKKHQQSKVNVSTLKVVTRPCQVRNCALCLRRCWSKGIIKFMISQLRISASPFYNPHRDSVLASHGRLMLWRIGVHVLSGQVNIIPSECPSPFLFIWSLLRMLWIYHIEYIPLQQSLSDTLVPKPSGALSRRRSSDNQMIITLVLWLS